MIKALKDEADNLRTQSERLNSLLYQSQQENQDLKGGSNQLANTMSTEVERLTVGISRITTEYNGLKSENYSTVTELSNQITELKAYIDDLLKQNQILKAGTSQDQKGTQDFMNSLILQLQELENRLNDRQSENSSLKQSIEQRSQEIDRLTSEIQRFHGDKDSLISSYEVEIKRLTQKLTNLQTVVKSISHDSEEWKMLLIENERLIAKISIIEQELNELRKVRIQKDQLQEDLFEVRAARIRAEDSLGARDREIGTLKNIIDELSQEIKIKMRIIDEKTFMLLDLEKEIDRERNDTSEIQKF